MINIKDFRGITAEKLIEALKQVPGDTKVCVDVLGDNFPIKTVEECIYYDWNNGQKSQEHRGIKVN
ncbi:hypothetical protein NE172_09025 [Clostridium botulinum]|uniref:Uncharacterized protein n=1 Tax=Clostridium botulinum TaxID=1491 RepID=A0A6B4JN71_CLOBO|nr:hypothetical protein [Clostridium botulinum]EES48309.1 hypothetical protein CLO_2833 [Clostridium botulinum E1 str. 'BoNT E Beluga']MBY6761461.1 hypothetical protein [Clostridium botulinum]MBY6920207.1 hypothetical protein [Clostridium botulinum]MCR1131098.1 hypothetical protein [Clostridium botulinum]NFJ58085.1 hypothetical protein [Clostridium botulinum]